MWAVVTPLWDAFVNNAEHFVAVADPYAQQLTPFHTDIPFVTDLAASVGQDPAVVKYLLVIFLCYPLSLIFALLRNKVLKDIFSLAVGTVLAQYVFGTVWLVPALSAAVTYLLILVLEVIPGARHYRHHVIFAWMLGFLTALHLYRIHVDYMGWSLDISGPQMLLTIKLTALGYNLYDGICDKRYAELIEKNKTSSPGLVRILSDRRKRSVKSIPNPLAYFAYVMCFTSFFAGPAFEYSEYHRSTTEESLVVKTDGKAAGPSMHWGSRLSATLFKMASGLVFLLLTMFVGPMFPFRSNFSPEVMNASFLYRAAYMYFGLAFLRCKYYCAWLLSEGSANLAGFGFNSEKRTWTGVESMDVLTFEVPPTMTDASKAWNKNTQSWLGRYASQRLPRSMSLYGTYALSAFWHGFYPGYYLFFLSAPLGQKAEKALAEKIKPRVQAMGKVAAFLYDAIGRLLVAWTLNYMVCPFVALGWEDGIAIWKSLYFAGHLGCIAVLVLLSVVPKVKKDKVESKKQSRKQLSPRSAFPLL